MAPDKLNIIFYIFIAIFSLTAIVTFLGITNIVTSIRERYLNAMFTALILEVVAAVILTYKQIDFSCETTQILTKLTREIEGVPEHATEEERILVLQAMVTNSEHASSTANKLDAEKQALEVALAQCEESKGSANDEISKLDKVFYSNVIKLRILAEKFRGRTINLKWRKEEKKEVYEVLGQIFIELGYINPDQPLSDDYIIDKYTKYAEASQWDYLLKKNEDGEYIQVLVDEYVTTLFLREYLNQKYPLKK